MLIEHRVCMAQTMIISSVFALECVGTTPEISMVNAWKTSVSVALPLATQQNEFDIVISVAVDSSVKFN